MENMQNNVGHYWQLVEKERRLKATEVFKRRKILRGEKFIYGFTDSTS
jgi:hypothetical protein